MLFVFNYRTGLTCPQWPDPEQEVKIYFIPQQIFHSEEMMESEGVASFMSLVQRVIP